MEEEQRYFSARKPAKCPACGASRVARIVWGYPGFETMQDAESGKIALGGCCVSDFDPTWQCLQCETSIYPEKLRGRLPPDLGTA